MLKKVAEKLKSIKDTYNKFLRKHYKKYIVNYEVLDERIKIIASSGDTRIVKNTKNNMAKINKAIVQNKIDIQRKIDEYENNYMERLIVLIINLVTVIGFGSLICLTFFIGNYFIFLMSIIFFSFAVFASTLTSFNYFIDVKEISNLKRITGYKKDMEFSLEDFKLTK